ncbi:proton-conducting transporter transmembrane domain-containing protein [Halomicrobium urmianum]|uniref:proton-conducting transporter transmembrane domain-containing protein n=1 Tax=Halomicrobium urmianum TaxID=1586233 RepID=UPI001CD92605|nr:proton-conducting transporter membrane subunit [Halomicrobium urmianum]
MTDNTRPNDAVPLSEATTSSSPFVPRASTWLVWGLFLLAAGLLAVTTAGGYELTVPGPFAVDGLTVLMWTVVTFFSGIVHSYSRRYMAGDERVEGFFARVLGFTLAVMTMAAADHLALFVAAWLAMGLLMASLIGHDREWHQARAAAGLARRYFVASSALLAVAAAILAWATGTATITGVLGSVDGIPTAAALTAAGCLVLAAMIQSALLPFHRWLLSSMTAPTTASALMHAGFVNAGGVLLTRFAPLFADRVAVMSAVVAVGAVSALAGQAMLLVQTDVKRKLGTSTVAQMGFMILQAGLGFFAAAITHLVLHGFYKAYLFLSSGAAVEQTAPKGSYGDGGGLATLAVAGLTAIGGGALFAALTGKGIAFDGGVALTFDSGVVLTLVVVVTTLHAARDVLRRTKLSPIVRLAATPLLVLTAIGVYGLLFEAISTVMADVPMYSSPTELTAVHGAVAALFVAGYAVTDLGWHRSSRRLYVTLLNLSQPDSDTVLTRKEDYNDA